jgi:hypothetical protein
MQVFKYTANRNLLEPTLGEDLALLALGASVRPLPLTHECCRRCRCNQSRVLMTSECALHTF